MKHITYWYDEDGNFNDELWCDEIRNVRPHPYEDLLCDEIEYSDVCPICNSDKAMMLFIPKEDVFEPLGCNLCVEEVQSKHKPILTRYGARYECPWCGERAELLYRSIRRGKMDEIMCEHCLILEDLYDWQDHCDAVDRGILDY